MQQRSLWAATAGSDGRPLLPTDTADGVAHGRLGSGRYPEPDEPLDIYIQGFISLIATTEGMGGNCVIPCAQPPDPGP